MGIYNELSRIQRELKAPKNLYNSFGHYNYRNAEGILEAVKPLLNGLVLLINDEPVMVGDRYYIKATATLTNGQEFVNVCAYAREDAEKKGMDGCQLTGTCSSYARKYALNALLMIDDSKDSDDDSLSPKNPENKEEDKANKDTTPPPTPPKGQVNIVPQVPPAEPTPPQNPPQNPPEPTPVQKYLLDAMKELREARDISPAKNNKLFADQRAALIKMNLAPNKDLTEYTMQEAKALIDAMWKNFDPDGTEVKNHDGKPA